MEKYDYLSAVKENVQSWINDNDEWKAEYADENGKWLRDDNRDDIEEDLNDRLFIEDSVTGNASGSYTFNTWQAEEYLCHNLDLLGEALEAFGCEPNYITEEGAEACDVTIRCYLLGQAISEVLDGMLEEDEE
jgi:hypothetical protein